MSAKLNDKPIVERQDLYTQDDEIFEKIINLLKQYGSVRKDLMAGKIKGAGENTFNVSDLDELTYQKILDLLKHAAANEIVYL
jgi:hypothetical protein